MASIATRQTADGPRYDVRWRNPGEANPRRKSFRRKTDAVAYRRQVEQAESAGVVVDPKRRQTLVSEVAERWLASNPAKRDSSAARDRAILTHHVLPTLGARPVGSVTRADVQKLVASWQAAGQAASTIGRQFSATRAVFAYAVNSELIDRNPAVGVKVPRARLVDRPQVDADTLQRVADALGEYGAMVALGAMLGLRWAEAAALTVGDVDVLARTVSVRRQLGRDGVLGPPKSAAGVRRLSVPAPLADLLADAIRHRGLTAADADALLFVNGAGRPLSYTNWRQRSWLPACKETGVPSLRFHDLRSMAATALVASGVDVKTAQTRLGHATPAMTLGLYARATGDADRAAADAVAAWWERDTPAVS